MLEELLENGHNHLLVDLTQTTYINSGGLRCLVSAWRRAKANEGSLSLCGLNQRLQEIFAMVGFDKVFVIYANCAGARESGRPENNP
jgi:anti-sigma B factor antagonist